MELCKLVTYTLRGIYGLVLLGFLWLMWYTEGRYMLIAAAAFTAWHVAANWRKDEKGPPAFVTPK